MYHVTYCRSLDLLTVTVPAGLICNQTTEVVCSTVYL